MSKFTKTIAGVLGFAIVLSLVVVATAAPAKADTISDLQAQIANLTAQLSKLAGGASATAAIATDKSSVGGMARADIVALQTLLISKGYSIPAGATGNYGPQTTKAVAAYQAANGIVPAAGYFGPKTRTFVNASVGSTGSTGSTGTTGSTSGITTPGVEGTINVTQESSNIKSTIYEGDSQDAVLGFRVEAKTSDMAVQRVKVIVGTTTNAYTKVFRKVYLTDAAGNVLASSDLNSSTVNRDSSTQYSITLNGFSSVVKKDAKASFYVKFDIYSGIDSDYRTTQAVSLATDGVRAIDGAGIDQYGGTTGITASPTVSKSLTDSAKLTLSTDPDVIKAQTIVANGGSANNEADLVTVASFRALAEKDGILVRDLTVTASSTTSGATEPTAYLYDGSTQIASAAGSVSGTSTSYAFTSIDQTIAKDSTKTFTVKVDVRNASATSEAFSIVGVAIPSAESSSSGNSVTVTSLSTVGNVLTFVSNGVRTTLSSANMTITATKDQNGVSTEEHLSATYNVAINAIGADAVFGAPASAFTFKVFKNGVDVTSTTSGYATAYYPATQPSGTVSYSATGFTVPRNASVTIPVGFKIDVTGSSTVATAFASGDYTVRLNGINYTVNGSPVTNDNSTNSVWVSNTVSRP